MGSVGLALVTSCAAASESCCGCRFDKEEDLPTGEVLSGVQEFSLPSFVVSDEASCPADKFVLARFLGFEVPFLDESLTTETNTNMCHVNTCTHTHPYECLCANMVHF